MKWPARRVYAGADRTLAYAVQMDGDRVDVIDVGVRFEPHDDHDHLVLTDPALLDFALEGTRPIHFVAHDGRIAVFYDGDGAAAVFEESIVRSGGEATRIDSAVLITAWLCRWGMWSHFAARS